MSRELICATLSEAYDFARRLNTLKGLTLRARLQSLDLTAGTIHDQSAPEDAGTEQVRLPALDADHREAELAEPVEQDLRRCVRFRYDATTAWRFRDSSAIACAVDAVLLS